MGIILNFLASYMNIIIVIMGIFVFCALLWNYSKLLLCKRGVKDKLEEQFEESDIDEATDGLVTRKRKNPPSREDMRKLEKHFNNDCSVYGAISQLIAIFPLLGILGTVAGLIMQVKSTGIDAMTSSLDLALYSTLFGLLITIILKIFVAMCSTKVIQDTEILFEDFEKKYNNVYMNKNSK